MIASGEDSWLLNGMFCFRSDIGINTQVHLARYDNGSIKELFVKVIDKTVHSPVCLADGVIVGSSEGVIQKFSFSGEKLFESKPATFHGASATIGKVNDDCIYMTATVFDPHEWYIYFVDISGAEPRVKSKHKIIPPVKIARTFDEIVVIGVTNVMRFPIPEVH